MTANQTHVVTATYTHNSVDYTVTASYTWNSGANTITYSDASISAADVIDPTLSSSSPADNTTGIAIDSNVVLNFDENVVVGTGNITIKKTADDSTVETIDVTSALVTGSGTSAITINPAADLAGGTEYYVLIDATAFDDAFANSYAGISSTTALSFTTADNTNPSLVH
jgi:methionine-rich copper-binding protein CopC